MSKFLFGRPSDIVAQALCDAGVITEPMDSIRRIVIDLEVMEPAKIYIEKFADDEKLAAVVSAGLTVTTAEAAA